MPTATFRFYGSLNDFLPPASRQASLVVRFTAPASLKDMMESLGIPHPEVDRVVVGGQAVGFDHIVADGDRIAAYPPFVALNLGDAGRVGPARQSRPRFVADVHLGKLAAYLRLAGIDTSYGTGHDDHELVTISVSEDRTILTRDLGLLKHGAVRRGYFVRETQPARQLVEVMRRFGLGADAVPFSRCLRCNELLVRAPKARVARVLPERTRELFDEYSQCPSCERVYWKGSHYDRMRRFIEAALEASSP